MSPSQLDYLQHILEEATFITEKTNRTSESAFYKDEVLKRAVVRSLEIIGEAAKKLSNDLRNNYPHIDWKSIVGMRDRLIHGYFGVDYEIVWDVAVNKIGALGKEIQKVIESESKREES